jgi:glucosylglycerate synthase
MASLKDKSFSGDSILSDDFLRQLIGVGEADVLVGIPSLNNAKTISHVVQAVEVGFAKFFPRERAVVVNADGGSRDGTEQAVRNASLGDSHRMLAPQSLRTMHRVTTRYQGAPGAANALKTILAAAELVRAKACAVVSPDLLSIRPGWIDGLLRPVYKEQYDLVTPLYLRQKFDGLLISNLVYPMVRAAYGLRVREPMASEFAFSGKLASHLLEQGVSPQDGLPYGTGIWVTTRAIVGGFRIGQCFLGPKIQALKDSARDIVATIRGVVADLFNSFEAEEAFWMGATGSQPAPAFGFPYDVALEPVRVNRKRLMQLFRTGVVELQDILKSILSEESFEGLRAAADPARGVVHFSDELWVKTIYDFAGAFHRSVINRDHVMQALVPLYRGRVASFTHEQASVDENRIEAAIESLCLAYEQLKPYWIEGWKLQR